MSVNLGEEEKSKVTNPFLTILPARSYNKVEKSRQKKKFMLIGSNCQLFLKQHDFASIFSVWSTNQLYKTWHRDVLSLNQCFKFNQF